MFFLPFFRELVGFIDLVFVAIDLHAFSIAQIAVFKEVASVLVLVFATFKEFAFNDAGISSRRFVNQKTVVIAEKLNYKLAIGVLRQRIAEFGAETEDNLIVHPFKKVLLRGLRHQTVNVPERVLFIAETVVRRNDDIGLLEHHGLVIVTHWELDIMVLLVKIISELVHTEDSEVLAVNMHDTVGLEVHRSEEVFLVDLARLVQGELLVHFLSFEHEGERVTAVVGRVDFADVDGVVGQVIVNDVRILTLNMELQDFAVVFQKLFLGFHAASAQFVFQVVHHLRVLDGDVFVL